MVPDTYTPFYDDTQRNGAHSIDYHLRFVHKAINAIATIADRSITTVTKSPLSKPPPVESVVVDVVLDVVVV